MFGVCRRQMKAIGYLAQLDRLFNARATTRSWNTIAAIARLCEREAENRRWLHAPLTYRLPRRDFVPVLFTSTYPHSGSPRRGDRSAADSFCRRYRLNPQQHAVVVLIATRPTLGQNVQTLVGPLSDITKAHVQLPQHRVDLPHEPAIDGQLHDSLRARSVATSRTQERARWKRAVVSPSASACFTSG